MFPWTKVRAVKESYCSRMPTPVWSSALRSLSASTAPPSSSRMGRSGARRTSTRTSTAEVSVGRERSSCLTTSSRTPGPAPETSPAGSQGPVVSTNGLSRDSRTRDISTRGRNSIWRISSVTLNDNLSVCPTTTETLCSRWRTWWTASWCPRPGVRPTPALQGRRPGSQTTVTTGVLWPLPASITVLWILDMTTTAASNVGSWPWRVWRPGQDHVGGDQFGQDIAWPVSWSSVTRNRVQDKVNFLHTDQALTF